MSISLRGRWAAAVGAALLTSLVAGTAQAAAASVVTGGITAAPQRHVIVQAHGNTGSTGSTGNTAAARALVESVGGHVDRTLGLISAVSATVPATAVARLSAVAEVTPDSPVRLASINGAGGYDATTDDDSLYRIEQIVGARKLWQAGYTGQGVDVALIDSGVADVQGLDGDNVVQGPDLTEESLSPADAHDDNFGHGTHLAGIIAGHDPSVSDVTKAAGDSTDFLGMAPDARIVSVKVADGNGVTDVSQVIAGIAWVVEHAHDSGMNIRVMNLSFGTDSLQPYVLDPLAYAAEQAWKHGIVVVTSAGNGGALPGHVSDPATDPFVIAVGADDANGTPSTNDDTIAPFSSRGDGRRNPDLVAPGVHVQSLRAPGSFIDRAYGATGAINGRFFRGSGTSQAAAVVTGAAALILQEQPNLTPDQVKYLLVSNAAPVPSAGAAAQGAGLLQLQPYTGPVPAAVQNFPASRGTGRLELSRGSAHVTVVDPRTGRRFVITGDRDIFGNWIDSAALAWREANGSAWDGGRFAGVRWTGDGWGSSSWASSSWASSSWASSSWASSSWASSSWASSSWASSSWASSSWASSSWASSSWASSSWASSSWASDGWSASVWQ
jgi:serine protease AprX